MPETEVSCEIVRGLNDSVVSDFFTSVSFSEGELFLDGIVRTLLESRGEGREQVVETLAPLFSQLQKNSIYIYRDSDHWAVHLSRRTG